MSIMTNAFKINYLTKPATPKLDCSFVFDTKKGIQEHCLYKVYFNKTLFLLILMFWLFLPTNTIFSINCDSLYGFPSYEYPIYIEANRCSPVSSLYP